MVLQLLVVLFLWLWLPCLYSEAINSLLCVQQPSFFCSFQNFLCAVYRRYSNWLSITNNHCFSCKTLTFELLLAWKSFCHVLSITINHINTDKLPCPVPKCNYINVICYEILQCVGSGPKVFIHERKNSEKHMTHCWLWVGLIKSKPFNVKAGNSMQLLFVLFKGNQAVNETPHRLQHSLCVCVFFFSF